MTLQDEEDLKNARTTTYATRHCSMIKVKTTTISMDNTEGHFILYAKFNIVFGK